MLLSLSQMAHAELKTAEQPLDEVGYAAVLDGPASMAIRGGHRALPVPSYVEVTELATGHTILVEISAQEPTMPGNVIALSCGAIRQLGVTVIPAAVRVRRVSPPDQERAVLSAGNKAAARLDAPEGLLSALRRKLPPAPTAMGKGDCGLPSGLPSPAPVASPPPPKPVLPVTEPQKPVPVVVATAEKPRPAPPVAQSSKSAGYVIQVAALSHRGRADALARSVGGYVLGAGSMFRVRTGPYASEASARAALPSLRAKGFADARVMPNEGR